MTDTVNVPRFQIEDWRNDLSHHGVGDIAAAVEMDNLLSSAPKAEPVSDPYKLDRIDPQIIRRLQSEADNPGIADSVMVFGPDLRALLRAFAAAQPLSNPQQLPEAPKVEQEPLGKWLSAALDDPDVCQEMKRDIRDWFARGCPPHPAQASDELLEALEWFCDRVDRGEVRSKSTYARFKALIVKYKGPQS